MCLLRGEEGPAKGIHAAADASVTGLLLFGACAGDGALEAPESEVEGRKEPEGAASRGRLISFGRWPDASARARWSQHTSRYSIT